MDPHNRIYARDLTVRERVGRNFLCSAGVLVQMIRGLEKVRGITVGRDGTFTDCAAAERIIYQYS